VDSTGGPAAGAHSFYRGAWPGVYDSETRAVIESLAREVDADAATEVWEAAIAEPRTGAPVWFHGDVAPGNLLVDGDARLTAVIDFGTCGVGDPACDLVIAWTLLDGDGRDEFRSRMGADSATWARARGWALWKALITVVPGVTSTAAADARAVIDDVLADHAAR
jgi:aminoglycoside phosphotransferase (APT) family kinase protein